MSDPRQPSLLIDAMAELADQYITASTDYIDSEFALKCLNREQRNLHNRIIKQDKGLFLTSYLLSFVKDQQEYELPADLAIIKRIEIAGTGSTSPFRNVTVSIESLHDRSALDGGFPAPAAITAVSCALNGRTLFIYPTPASAQTNVWRIWYYKRPVDMHFGKAQAGSVDTITLDVGPTGAVSSDNDHYNRAYLITTGGTGSGQIRKISDYVGDTLVATVSTDWTTNPDSTTTYEILCGLQADEVEVLILGALRRLAQKDGDVSAWGQNFGSDYFKLRSDLFEMTSRLQTNNKRRMRVTYL